MGPCTALSCTGHALHTACMCKVETYWPGTGFMLVFATWEGRTGLSWGMHMQSSVCSMEFVCLQAPGKELTFHRVCTCKLETCWSCIGFCTSEQLEDKTGLA